MLTVAALAGSLLLVAAFCWFRMGPESDFEVIIDPGRVQLHRHWASMRWHSS